MSVDVVMLTHNHPEYVVAAMDAMGRQGVPFAGYLLDNSDVVEDRAANQNMAWSYGWRYLCAFDNLPFSAANNWAARSGTGERILLLNDDAILRPGALAAMLEHPEAIVGGLMVQTDGRVNHAGVYIHRSGMPDHLGRYQAPEGWRLKPCEAVEAVTFAVVLIRRGVWSALDGLDEAYEWSYEDTDFCLRARAAGETVVACRRAEALHNELGTRTGANDERNLRIFRARWADAMATLPAPPATGGHPAEVRA